MRTRVKMCGTTRLSDGLAAVQYGVDALGFILYPRSPRYISPEDAGVISGQLPPFVDRVGVLVDEKIDVAVAVVKRAGLSCLQLHGSESSDYCRELRSQLTHIKLIKAFRVGEKTEQDEFTPYAEHADAFLLDTYVKGGRGGTGQVFDWSVVADMKLNRPVILAGGLKPENITSAISVLRPYGVDINSGVEDGPGKKNHARLKQMMEQIASCHENSAEEAILR